MITHAKTLTICVTDQQQALDYYRDKLGFELLQDEPMGPDARWIVVAPPGAQTGFVLFTPPGLEDRIDTFTGIVYECDDIDATFHMLTRRGVKFTSQPTMQPWGLKMAMFEDLDGNGFVLVGR